MISVSWLAVAVGLAIAGFLEEGQFVLSMGILVVVTIKGEYNE